MADQRELMEDGTTINTINEIPRPAFKFTMEVPLFLLMVGISLSGAVINNMLLFRTCIHSLNYSEEQCNLLHAPGEKSNETKIIEEESQKYATIVTMIRSIIEAVCPAILSLFLGVWSDTHGRKPLVVWPLLGMSMTAISVVIYSIWLDLGPWWYILTAVPISLCGGLTAIFTGSFSYISDITTNNNRSFRLALLEASIFLGSIIGSLLSSYLVQLMGSIYVLLLHSIIYVVAYVFTNLYVNESLTGALEGGICSVLDLLLVKEMISTCFKERPNKTRTTILLLLFANSLSIFILYGLLNLEYLYTRQKLEWDLQQYTVFSASNTMLMVLGLFIGVSLIQKCCKVSDIILSLLSFLSSIAEVVTRALVFQSWHMYLGASISMFRGLAGPLTRSYISKIIPMEDIAQVFALGCAIDAILPVFSPLVFNGLYTATISTFPGAIYVMSAGIYFVCFICVIICQYYNWKYPVTTPYASLISN